MALVNLTWYNKAVDLWLCTCMHCYSAIYIIYALTCCPVWVMQLFCCPKYTFYMALLCRIVFTLNC